MGGGRIGSAELGGVPRLYGLLCLSARWVKRAVHFNLYGHERRWALVIIHGSALAPQLEIVSYIMTGIVAFLMCIQARQLMLSFVPGTFIGACATFAGSGDWHLVVPSLALGLVFGYAMKNSGLWLATRAEKNKPLANQSS